MSKRKRRTTNDVRKLLEKHGCELLSEEYKNLDTFISIKIRDTIKNMYCDKNNLNLIRIPYWEINNIEEILNNKIINKSNNHE